MKTLWDLVRSLVTPAQPPAATCQASPVVIPAQPLRLATAFAPRRRPIAKPTSQARSMQDRYDEMVRTMLDRYGVRVRKWRSSMSGVAWELAYADGRRVKLLESPKPKGPMSAAIFLHEIGHHAIGLGVYRPRCLEEFHAWDFAIRTMQDLDLNISDAVHRRMHASLHYAIAKAGRRGLKDLPPELVPFTTPPPRRARAKR
jgi:hypothetical protein